MDPDYKLEEFKSLYLKALQENNSNLPIVSSMGKQTLGKSYFLGHLFNDPTISNKHRKFVKRGTNVLSIKPYDSFLLVDMEGLDGTQGSTERDILNFSTSFSITDIILLHISQTDLESTTFLDNFAYSFWHSSKISSKFNLSLPDIILLIRDPGVSVEDEKTFLFYKKLVNEFKEGVNYKTRELEKRFIDSVEKVLMEKNGSSKGEADLTTDILKKLREEEELPRFEIYRHFCIYHMPGLGKQKIKYFQMKRGSKVIKIVESKFSDLIRIIRMRLQEKKRKNESMDTFRAEKYFGIDAEPSKLIHDTIIRSNLKNKEKIFSNILIEVKYNVFSHFRNIEGYLRFMEQFNQYLLKFEKINAKISREINNTRPGEELDSTISKLKEKHKQRLSKIINKSFIDPNLIVFVLPYLKYLSSTTYCETFRLSPGIPHSSSYQTLFTILHFTCEDFSIHQLSQISKNLNMYQSLAYYDEDFESLSSTMLNYKFNLYETLLSVYKKKIQDFLEIDYRYKEDLQSKCETIQNEVYLPSVLHLIQLLKQRSAYPTDIVDRFLIDLKRLYKLVIVRRLETLGDLPAGILVKTKTISESIYSLSLYERLMPSIFGILLSITTNVIRNVIIAASTDTGAAAGLIWLGYLGWIWFGVRIVGSVGWVIYKSQQKIQKKKIKFEFNPGAEHVIIDESLKVTRMNGEFNVGVLSTGPHRFKFTAEASSDVTLPKSAFVQVEFVIHYCLEGESRYYEAGTKKLEDIFQNFSLWRN